MRCKRYLELFNYVVNTILLNISCLQKYMKYNNIINEVINDC